MKFLKERTKVICAELEKFTRKNRKEIPGFMYREGFFLTPEEAHANGREDGALEASRQSNSQIGFEPFAANAVWGKKADFHAWFTAEFKVPEELSGKQLMFSFSTQEHGWGATNPQFLFFLDGEPVHGLDANHTEVLISTRAETGRVYRLDLQAYSDLPRQLEFRAEYFEFLPSVYGLMMDLKTAVFSFEKQDENSPAFYRLQNAINNALNMIDLRRGGKEVPEHGEAFPQSVDAAREYLSQNLYGAQSEITATAIGHTHIDVAWWWTVAQTREKAARSFATEVKLLDEYGADGFKFMSSQPQLYKFVKERYPGLYEKIKRLAAEGKWETEGGMWLEADCNLTSGESLVRQLLHGKNFFKQEFGAENEILWLPDVFGYSAALPQIMKKSGIKYFMTTKISWNQFNKLPYDTFMWKGIDGTETLTHLITTPNPGQDIEKDFNTTYNGSLHPSAVAGAWNRYQQKQINNDVLICFGHGDGGGGCTREMIEYGIRLNKGVPGMPRLRFEKAGVFFRELEERVEGNKNLPKWVGELYLEYHRGTYTSMARNKRSNRKLEFLLGELEFISIWSEQIGLAYPQKALLDMWEIVLRNQFHDILPGSSIKEVYEVTKKEYAAIALGAEKLFTARAEALLPKVDDAVTVLNTLSFNRSDAVVFNTRDGASPSAVLCGGGLLPVQKTHDGKLIAFVKDVPSKGYKVFPFADTEQKTQPSPFEFSQNGISTPHFSVSWDEDGFFTSVYDRRAGRETLKRGGRGNRLTVYEDKPMDYDNWDIDIYYTEKSWLCGSPAEIRWLERGPVRAALYVKRNFLESVIEQKIYFYADIPRVDFDTRVDWKLHQCLLKTEFDVDINASEATYDIQFGNVKRPTHFNTSWDVARFEVCGHKYADVSEGGFGAALINDCKYGYGIHDGKMTLSLVKSGIVPNPDTDVEEHFFTYSFMPHACGFAESNVPEQAYTLNVPLRAVNGTRGTENVKAVNTGAASVEAEAIGTVNVGVESCGTEASFVSVTKGCAALETVKKSYDGKRIIIRLFEYRNVRGEMELTFESPLAAAHETDLMENRLGQGTDGVIRDKNRISFELKPFEIKTFEVELHGNQLLYANNTGGETN